MSFYLISFLFLPFRHFSPRLTRIVSTHTQTAAAIPLLLLLLFVHILLLLAFDTTRNIPRQAIREARPLEESKLVPRYCRVKDIPDPGG